NPALRARGPGALDHAPRPEPKSSANMGRARLGRRIQRERHDQAEHGAAPDVADDLNLAAKYAREILGDGEPQPGAGLLSRKASVELVELLEDQLLLFLGDTRPVVDHADANALLIVGGSRRQAFRAQNDQRLATRALQRQAELHGVGQEIEDDLLELSRV